MQYTSKPIARNASWSTKLRPSKRKAGFAMDA